MDDQEAIGQLKRGEIAGLEFLVHKYQLQAIRAAHLITRDQFVAEDIVQNAFLRSYERIHQFEVCAPFGPWFLRMVINDALKAVSRQKAGSFISLNSAIETASNTTALLDTLCDPLPSPEELLEWGETRQAIWQALGKLSPAQRAAVVLHYYIGLKEAEIAQQLHSPTGTVKSRLHTARTHLRKLLSSLVSG